MDSSKEAEKNSVKCDLTYTTKHPVVTVQAEDFGKDIESHQPIVGTTTNQKLRIWKIAAAVFVVAAIAGIAVGIVLATKNGGWNQPDSPRRALLFSPSFSSCKALREAFGEKVNDDSNSVIDAVYVEPTFHSWDHHYPSDYCEFCNCPDSWEPPMIYYAEMAVEEAVQADSGAGSAEQKDSASEYTGTNNQVQNVDESDIVKTDGQYVYILPRNQRVLVIATAYPFDQVSVVSSTNLTQYNMEPSEMLLDGDNLVIIGSALVSNLAGDGTLSLVSVQLWDISARDAPLLRQTQEVEGNFNTARLIEGFVYAVIETYPYAHYWFSAWGAVADMAVDTSAPYYEHNNAMKRLVPLARFLDGEEANIDSEARVPLTPITDCTRVSSVEGLGVADSWLTVVSVATQGPQLGKVQSMTHAGRGGNVYVSSENLYIAATNYDYFSGANREATGQLPSDGVWTGVLKFAIAGGKATFQHLVTVPGSVLNQFSMDEHQGHFRVATTYGEMWSGDSVSNVFIVDGSGEQTGAVTGLAPGERIFSARFQGDRGYIVTFRQVDPLFVLDLADPARPAVLGELKIPGWSDYLHPVNKTHLIGIGKAATMEGVVQGVKVALFDATDPTAPKEQYSLELGDRGTESEALWDHKAVLYHAASGLLALPLTLREIPGKAGKSEEELRWAYGELVMDGAVVLRIGAEGFEQRGYVEHAGPPAGEDWWAWDNVNSVFRSGYMAGSGDGAAKEEVLFTYSQRQIQVHSLDTLTQISAVTISEPECDAEHGPRE